LADGNHNAAQIEPDLRLYLFEATINGRLDQAGGFGEHWGLAIITLEGEEHPVEGRVLGPLLGPNASCPFFGAPHRILISKEAVLEFARVHELPAPSWWADHSDAWGRPANSVNGAPKGDAEGSSRPKQLSAFSPAQAQRAYSNRVDQIGTGRSSESEDFKFMRNLFPRISRDVVRSIRCEQAPAHWKKGGRPRKPRA
jgi:hypothetical protein